MRRHWLKYMRAALAIAVLAIATAALVDFRSFVPAPLAHTLASVQFVPAALGLATGATTALAAITILVATFAFGRIYCSVICPLGLLQDAFTRLAGWLRPKPEPLRFTRPATWIRQLFLWGSVSGIAAGWGGLTLTLLDPYSIFGRTGSMLFRPVVVVVNNWIVGPANAAGLNALYRVPAHWASVGALALPAAMLLVIAVLAARRGRLYCNTICPVGTLLGLLAARGAWRLEIDQKRCRKCADCLPACKAQCIDLRSGTIDNSRCVACYNCISACDKLGIQHRFKWKPEGGNRKPETQPTTPSAPPWPLLDPRNSKPKARNPRPEAAPQNGDASRRAFISGTATALTAATGVSALLLATRAAATASTPGLPSAAPQPPSPPPPSGRNAISPPGSGTVARFLDRCTACQLCVSACPTYVLQPSFLEYSLTGVMKPRLDFNLSFCNFNCHRCAEVCPDGAILPLALADKQLARIGIAYLDFNLCIVKANGTDCAACSEHCPTQAVNTVPYGKNLRRPEMHPELCIGCGACEYACPVRPRRAIIVHAQAVHDRATRKIEAKAVAPTPGDDFPF